MRAVYSPMSVGDYCKALNDGLIIVNDEYQRNAGVWTGYARSFFIESILLEYPIPKIFLYSKIDLRTRQTVKEIVDGQQRSHALQMFYNKKFRLSIKLETEELRGKNYNQLSEEFQSAFLSYSLPIDEFRGVQPAEIQESFRRMNASNVPLNDEEQRNAKFQGPFKWFVQGIVRRYAEPLRAIGLLSRRDIVRMADTKIVSEIMHTLIYGFETTKAAQLNKLYREHNTTFDEEERYQAIMEFALDTIIARPDLHEKELMRSYMFQTMATVLIDRQFKFGLLHAAEQICPEVNVDIKANPPELALILDSMRDPESYPQLGSFLDATKGTNVARAKAVRFLYLNSVI